jgi:hypothetical protein
VLGYEFLLKFSPDVYWKKRTVRIFRTYEIAVLPAPVPLPRGATIYDNGTRYNNGTSWQRQIYKEHRRHADVSEMPDDE